MGIALSLAALTAPGASAEKVEVFESLASSPADLTALAADPTTQLIYAQENDGTNYFVYDPRTDAWSGLSPAPINSGNNGGAVYLDGKIYISYTENDEEIAIYDIATDSWTTIEDPLELGTGDITAADGKLYLADKQKFVEYDLETETTTELDEPPAMPGCMGTGFEPWGGLQVDEGKIYGHQGNGCSGFSEFDIATNEWTELEAIPPGSESSGAVLGSVIDPVTHSYLTYGGYGGTNLYRYDLDGGSWTVEDGVPLNIEDGGLAYLSLPGYAGVYLIEGEEGAAFTRLVNRGTADLSISMSSALTATSTGGTIVYSIKVKNEGPETAELLRVSDPLPAGTTLVSATAGQGSCAGTPSVTCAIEELPSGASADLTITVAAVPGTFTNVATVSARSLDENVANDKATAVNEVAKPPVAASCKVPKLRGLKLKKAKKALRKAGCAPGKVTRRNNAKVKKGKVVKGGRPGTVLAAGAKVKLTVSSGPKKTPKP